MSTMLDDQVAASGFLGGDATATSAPRENVGGDGLLSSDQPIATSDAASFPVSPLMGGRDQDRTGEAASGAAGSPSGLSEPARPTDNRMLRDLLAALRKLGVID